MRLQQTPQLLLVVTLPGHVCLQLNRALAMFQEST